MPPSQMKGHSSRRDELVNKRCEGGPGQAAHPATPCPQLLPVSSSQTLCAVASSLRLPQEKPSINLTLIGFSICHNPRRSWGGGREGEAGVITKHQSSLQRDRPGPWMAPEHPRGSLGRASPSWPQLLRRKRKSVKPTLKGDCRDQMSLRGTKYPAALCLGQG